MLQRLAGFYAGQQVVLLWDGLPAHWSHAMHAWMETQQHWLQVERLPASAPELNSAEQGVRRVCDDQQLAWSFLAHTGLTLDHQPPPNL